MVPPKVGYAGAACCPPKPPPMPPRPAGAGGAAAGDLTGVHRMFHSTWLMPALFGPLVSATTYEPFMIFTCTSPVHGAFR